ncbi:MAG: glycosyltransferase family 1 protein [Candidatus Competibacteraceae bacterium]
MNKNKPDIQIGINAISLLTPLTGIGQYTHNLALELQKDPSLSLSYFYGPFWSERLYLSEQKIQQTAQQSKAIRRSNVLPTVVTSLKKIVKAVMPYPYEVARFLQQRAFSKGAKDRRIMLYHDPNFIPYCFDGPVVITIHDLSMIKYPETHPADRIRAIGQQLPSAVARADAIIAVTEATRQEILATFDVNPQKVIAIHNGVGRHFQPLSQAETAPVLHPQRLTHRGYILNVGTLEPRKNLIRLARAYRSLPATLRERYPLVIVGMKGWHYESIGEELEPLIRSGHLRLLGYIPTEALPALYAGAAMLVYPSLYEGFGLPLVEAMASGTPVITSNRSSMPEVVGDVGILVEPEDESMIAGAIRRLLEDSNEALRLQRQGLERVRQFTWERCAQQTLAVYRKVLQSTGTAPA